MLAPVQAPQDVGVADARSQSEGDRSDSAAILSQFLDSGELLGGHPFVVAVHLPVIAEDVADGR